jgi:hypothetical protein
MAIVAEVSVNGRMAIHATYNTRDIRIMVATLSLDVLSMINCHAAPVPSTGNQRAVT